MSLNIHNSSESVKNQSEISLEIASLLQDKFETVDDCHVFLKQAMQVEFYTSQNWYKGLRTPSLKNFLLLAQHVPEVMNWLLDKAGYFELSGLLNKQSNIPNSEDQIPQFDHNRLIFETNNSGNSFIKFQKLNMRQLWFYNMAQQGHKMRPERFQKYFNISRATAYREINMLVSFDLILQVGKGHYKYYAPL